MDECLNGEGKEDRQVEEWMSLCVERGTKRRKRETKVDGWQSSG